ncbi:unnamed protein product, partial [Brenthis ino]
MKFLVVIALCAAVASANLIGPITAIDQAAEIKEIIAAINHPSTDPATAAALQQMLDQFLAASQPNPIHVGPAIVDGEYEPIHVGPAIVDGEHEPIHVGPAIVDGEYEPISVGPAIIDGEYEPISVGPAIVDESVVGASSPLVQIIINVKPNSGSSVINPAPVIVDDFHGLPVIVDRPELIITPVEEPQSEPINVVDMPDSPPAVGPITPVNVPDFLN